VGLHGKVTPLGLSGKACRNRWQVEGPTTLCEPGFRHVLEGQTGTSWRLYVHHYSPDWASAKPNSIAVSALGRLGAHLPMVWIHEALDATKKATIRNRRLPAEYVVQAIIAMGLYRQRSMSEVTESLDLVLPDGTGAFVSKSAITQARQKLGAAPLELLFRDSSLRWTTESDSEQPWNGLSLWAMDGTSLRTPDSKENRMEFGAQIYPSGKVSSCPQVRIVTLTSIPSRMVVDASFGEYAKNEMRYAEDLIIKIRDNSLTIFDKGFFSAALLLGLTNNGHDRHFLIPARKDLRYERISGTKNDAIVRMSVSKQAQKMHPELPQQWSMRMIRAKDSQGNIFHLLTSLQDSKKYSAKELIYLYARRWEIETSYCELKVTMSQGAPKLRSFSPEMIKQEIWATFIAYNLVRKEMAEVARRVNASPCVVSFVRSMHLLQDKLLLQAAKSRDSKPFDGLMERRQRRIGQLLHKPGKGRKCPRVVKAKPKKYEERWVRASESPPARTSA